MRNNHTVRPTNNRHWLLAPLAVSAAMLATCVATLGTLTGQTAPSGGASSSAASGSGSSAVATSRYPIVVRMPASPRSSTSSSQAAMQSSASSAPASSLPAADLSEDERDVRAMLKRVLTTKSEQRIASEGLVFTLASSSASNDLIIQTPANQKEPPGCFSRDGIWTVDGTTCAPSQGDAFLQLRARSRFERESIAMGMPTPMLQLAAVSLTVPTEEAEETRMNSVLEAWYPEPQTPTDDSPDALRQLLRGKMLQEVLKLAFTRFQQLATDVRRVPSVAQRLSGASLWAQQTLSVLQANKAMTSTAQLDQVDAGLRSALDDARNALGSLPTVPPDFVSMQQMISRIVERAPLVFARLGDADIPLPSYAAEAYLEAKDHNDALQECDGAGDCPSLQLAADALMHMADELDIAIGDSGEFWMYDEADLIFRAE